MLVKLYELPLLEPVLAQQKSQGISIRRGLVPEKHVVSSWVRDYFSRNWESEVDVSFSRLPVSCFVATKDDTLVGFACYDATTRGIFGPTGVSEDQRGKGIGTALLIACLHGMRDVGYGYAVIGWAGPLEYYEKIVGAVAIPGSRPGIYEGLLKSKS